MSQHTPGPWHRSEVEPTCVYGGASREADPTAPLIAQMDSGFWVRSREECAANARLIAAAPDLLVACQAADDTLRAAQLNGFDALTFEDALEHLRAAIAKATEARS